MSNTQQTSEAKSQRKLKIAYGNGRESKKWRNGEITWDEMCEKLRSTYRTRETVEEYQHMSSDERSAAKDNGAFVGGHLRDGRRRVEDVECRSFLTLDVDYAQSGFIELFTNECKYAAALYSTHSHTPEKPRLRIVMPLKEDVSPDCYVALSRFFAATWNIELFDKCSFSVNQPMFWPTTPSDGEFVSRIITGPFLDALEFLENYPDWRDPTALPRNSHEKTNRVTGKKQEDPLQKEGIVGTFCRTYSIEDAIRKYLPDIYEETTVPNRWTYIPGESSAGLVIYDDKFAYSHHATDPAGGMLLNAFDLVRIHKYPGEDEKDSFLKMCALAESDSDVKELYDREKLESAQNDFEKEIESPEEPIPFGKYHLEPFPIDALPPDIGNYVQAVAESTQTPPDMAGTAALSLVSVCIQGKYVIQGKADWFEPLNTFTNIIASPSERKSAVLRATTSPLDNYEIQYNKINAGRVEDNKMRKRILERNQKAIEEQASKGKATQEDIERIAQEIAYFTELKPLRLYVDDVTTEKLISIMSANHGNAALISSEGGIFDTLAGIYTKNVNIDVMLKGYSGDTIRVDRIGRESESIMNPCLSILLMTQPKVVSDALSNATFRGRGLTARFLYCLPQTSVGSRKFQSDPVPSEVLQRYEQKMTNMLDDEFSDRPEVITLSADATAYLTAFADEIEPKLKTDYADIADWAGKLVGNTLRISGLLCRASTYRFTDFLDNNDPLVVSGETMKNSIRLGRYYLSHALAVFDAIPEETMHKQANRILNMIKEKKLTEFNRRTTMRYCQSFKRVDDIQPVLDFLDDYGYIIRMPDQSTSGGRPPLPRYTVNPSVLS